MVDGKLAYDVYGDRWSRFTFLIYLNDDFDGGATTFYTPSERRQIAPPDASHASNSLALHLAAHDARRASDANAQERSLRTGPAAPHACAWMGMPPCKREGRGGPSPGADAKGASADPLQMKPG